MRGGDKEVFNKVLFSGCCANNPLSSSPLGAVFSQWISLNVASMGYGYHDIFFSYQIFVREICRWRTESVFCARRKIGSVDQSALL